MKERPILFSGPMVKAILDGKKTQTRRVCKQADMHAGMGIEPFWADAVYPARDSGYIAWQGAITPGPHLEAETKRFYKDGFRCPYGAPGDRLWVRETWALKPGTSDCAWYAAEFNTPSEAAQSMGLRWKPSIHMPRALSRITLEVTSVRVERVQQISRADEIAEGVQPFNDGKALAAFYSGVTERALPKNDAATARYPAFAGLWDSINAARGFGWDVNPWVWVVEFRRAQP